MKNVRPKKINYSILCSQIFTSCYMLLLYIHTLMCMYIYIYIHTYICHDMSSIFAAAWRLSEDMVCDLYTDILRDFGTHIWKEHEYIHLGLMTAKSWINI